MSRTPTRPPPRSLHWSLYFLLWTIGLIAVGTVAGTLLFPLVGTLIGAQFTLGELAINGAKMLGFYFMLWAPGLALVMTIKRAYEQRKRQQ
jgi:hypothetical protein